MTRLVDEAAGDDDAGGAIDSCARPPSTNFAPGNLRRQV